jgi:micrococcal nuclease
VNTVTGGSAIPGRPAGDRCRALPVLAVALALALGASCTTSSSHRSSGVPPATSPAPSARPPLPGAPSSLSTSASAVPVGVSSGLTRPSDALGPYPITDVVDGDTDKIDINGRTVKLRLIGIDTPETKHPSKPVQCFGPQASARAEQLLAGRSVWIQYDSTQSRRDIYGRDLVYVWLDAHTMFNEVMVSSGYAHEYTYDRPYRYQSQFKAAEAKAKAAGLGFWSRQTCAGNTEQAASSVPLLATPTPVAQSAVPTDSSGQVYYSSCSKVRAAGKAPLLKGQPGYRAGLDGDHNGVACQ